MNLVVDANIIFSVLIKSGKTEEILFESSLNLFSPEFIFEEFNKYKKEILEKTYRSESEFEKLMLIIKKKIATVSNEETEEYITGAEEISPDPKDVDYIALALKLKCGLWSQDKALSGQSRVKVYTTEELARIFSYAKT
ncbi:hypothetical protein J4401_03590 [Candidatus Woesearchaeota archaeon]|nr:hypothetical protein [Candidatus Woesearchaeota archaeon]